MSKGPTDPFADVRKATDAHRARHRCHAYPYRRGPLLGTLFMQYAIDITSSYTTAWLLVVGVALILLIVFFPRGILGSIRDRWVRWLP